MQTIGSPRVFIMNQSTFSLKYDGNDVPGEVKTLEINPANHKEVSMILYVILEPLVASKEEELRLY